MVYMPIFMLTTITYFCINRQVYCDNKIINSIRKTEPCNFPFIVSIQSVPDHYHHCGGSLINWCHVLTNAHCIAQSDFYNKFTVRSIQDFRIVAGDDSCVYGKNDTENERLQFRNPIQMFLPSQYKPIQIENDIGIIRLDYPFDQTEYVNIISISWLTPKPNERCLFVECGQINNTLERSVIQIREQSYCNSTKMYNGKMPKYTICATIDNVESFSLSHCGSGYPLICHQQLFGVISFGFGCEIYTDVSKFRDWIDSTVKENESCVVTSEMRSSNSDSINLNLQIPHVMAVIFNYILFLW